MKCVDVVVYIGIGILIVIMIMMMFTHSMALQQFGALELVMLLFVSVGVFVTYNQSATMKTQQYYETLAVQCDGLSQYIKEVGSNKNIEEALKRYTDLEKELAKVVKQLSEKNVKMICTGACLIRRETNGGFEECYTIGEEKFFWDENKKVCTDIVEESLMSGQTKYLEQDNGYTLFVVADKTDMMPQYAVVIEVANQALEQEINKVLREYLITGIGISLLATVFFVLLVFFQCREVNQAVRLVTKIAEGKEDWQMVEVEKKVKRAKYNEMKLIYKGLRQIVTDLERVSYEKYRALQIYYRFAPKDIEKVMCKQSILDVGTNEQVELKAVLAYISFNISEHIEQYEHMKNRNNYYTWLGHNRKKYGGIIFNSSSDLSMIQMMFPQKMEESIQFAIELVAGERTAEQRKELFVMLHDTKFVYGISGDDEQAFTYAHSKEWKALEKYIDKLRGLGVRVAVTEEVYENIPTGMKSRYLGFIVEEGKKYHLHELLDAYSMKERQKRLDSKEKYDEAMQLFYQADFYFARILFTEILKDCPDDDVVKHYIFRCEKCLSGEKIEESKMAIF